MITVLLSAPAGVGPPSSVDGIRKGFVEQRSMPAVPREGDTISLGEPDSEDEWTYHVHVVHWYPDAADCDVYIVLR